MDHIAEVFLDVPDNYGDLEADALVYAQTNHGAGTTRYWVEETDTSRELYDRTVFNTLDWLAQVKHDIAEIFEGQEVGLLTPDGGDW